MSIDPELLRATIAERLPLHATWMIQGTPLRYDFSLAQRPLAPLSPEAVLELDAGWMEAQADLLIFGEYDYAGGARPWLGVRQGDGVVFGLDVELEDSRFFLNSSAEQFIATFDALHPFLSAGEALPSDIEATLSALDPQFPASDWQGLVSLLLE